MSKAAELAALIGGQKALGDKNLIHNGAMKVDQRNAGSSITVPNATNTFVVDRFRINESSGAVFTAQQVDDAPVGLEYSSKITVSTADTSLGAAEFNRIMQGIEGKNISHLNWGTSNAKTLTLSFYVKSSVTGQYYVSVFNSAANRTLLKGYTIDSANTWEKKTITVIGDQTGTWLTTNGLGIYIMWSLGTGSNYQSNTLDAYQASFAMAKSDQVNFAASVNSTWQLTGVQLEIGEAATAFEHEEIGITLRKCQRYFESSYNLGTAPASATTVGIRLLDYATTGANSGMGHVSFCVPKRATPSTITYDGAGTANKVSTTPNNTTFTDGRAYTGAPFGVSTTGFNHQGQGAGGNLYNFIHFTAEIEL